MKTKKSILLISLLLFICVIFTGCGGDFKLTDIMSENMVSYLDYIDAPREEFEDEEVYYTNGYLTEYLLGEVTILDSSGIAVVQYSGESDTGELIVQTKLKYENINKIKKQLEKKMDIEASDDYTTSFEIDIPNYNPEMRTYMLFWESLREDGLIEIRFNQYSKSLVTNSNKNDNAPHTDREAWVCAQNIVEDYLKSPSTAKFCTFKDATVTYLGDDKYKVRGYVDAQNSFGATIREYFTVTYTATSSGYKEASCSFS